MNEHPLPICRYESNLSARYQRTTSLGSKLFLKWGPPCFVAQARSQRGALPVTRCPSHAEAALVLNPHPKESEDEGFVMRHYSAQAN